MPARPDNPIRHKDQDELGRARTAEVIAREIRSLDASEGCVVGILGPWGSGKTSLLNLTRDELVSQHPILEFNPWIFSGTDDLLDNFFIEVGAQFRSRADRLADLADDVEAYGEVVAPLRHLPVLGVWVERARSIARAIKKARDLRRGGVLAQRDRLAQKLSELEAPVIVVVDDIDRLRTSEIRDIFKLVRLTASFPNVIYIMAFDRQRVEAALSEDQLPGRDYLEKILQVAWDIPAIPDRLLLSRLTREINDALEDIEEPGAFHSSTWPDVVAEIIFPLVRNMRDVRRYTGSIHGTIEGLEGRVALVDVLALEAVRVFLPDAFLALQQAQEGLTTPSPSTMRGEPPRLKAAVDAFVDAGGDRSDVTRAVVDRLFPAANRHIGGSHYGGEWLRNWLRERRVAHPDILRFYLDRVVGTALQAFTLAERAFSVLDDRTELESLLGSIEGELLADTISALEVYEDEYPPEAVVPASIALQNAISRVPEREGGLYSVRPDMIVGRVVLRLLKRLPGPAEVETAVRTILPELRLLSDKFDLIRLVGHREGAGHKLISEQAAADLERQVRDEIRAASAQALAGEWDVLRLLYAVRKESDPSEPALSIPEDPGLDAVLLREAVSVVTSQPMDSRAVSSRKQMYWDTLIEVVGDEAAVQRMIERIDEVSDDAELADAVKLARKYLRGWRPPDF